MTASAKTIARIEKLIWVLIYGGLFAVILGLANLSAYPVGGWWLLATGALAATAGVVLIWVRSRLSAAD